MKHLTLSSVAEFSGGSILAGDIDHKVRSISTDTRKLRDGALYVALKGETFDGHDFLEQAIDAGAAAVMVNEGQCSGDSSPFAVVGVEDTYVGLQLLAHNYRLKLGLTVIGITGSNGKTSTKDLIASVLAEDFSVCATVGNFNNHIGLPLTILSADDSHEFGVWEMGMSMPGEISQLARIAVPDIGVVTNIGMAHIESMKTREAIALEKGMLAEAIDEGGVVVLNAEDAYTESIKERCRARVVTVGFGAGDFRAVEVKQSERGMEFSIVANGERHRVYVPASGRHMVTNALMAAAVGAHLGLSMEAIARGLSQANLTAGRMQHKTIAGVDYIDDSYNANPDSTIAAINTLAGKKCAGRRILVMGGMAELGDISIAEHRQIGRAAVDAGIDCILSVGELAEPIYNGAQSEMPGSAQHFENHQKCIDFLQQEVSTGDLVLIKGSRSSAMERIMEELG